FSASFSPARGCVSEPLASRQEMQTMIVVSLVRLPDWPVSQAAGLRSKIRSLPGTPARLAAFLVQTAGLLACGSPPCCRLPGDDPVAAGKGSSLTVAGTAAES